MMHNLKGKTITYRQRVISIEVGIQMQIMHDPQTSKEGH